MKIKGKKNIKDNRKSKVQINKFKLNNQINKVYLKNGGSLRTIPFGILIEIFLKELHLNTPLARYVTIWILFHKLSQRKLMKLSQKKLVSCYAINVKLI